jgi:hypothetical protein
VSESDRSAVESGEDRTHRLSLIASLCVPTILVRSFGQHFDEISGGFRDDLD